MPAFSDTERSLAHEVMRLTLDPGAHVAIVPGAAVTMSSASRKWATMVLLAAPSADAATEPQPC